MRNPRERLKVHLEGSRYMSLLDILIRRSMDTTSYDVPHFINGERISPQGEVLPIYNPTTGNQEGQTTIAKQSLVDEAVSAAKSAFEGWSKTSPALRAKILFKFKTILDQNI